MIVIALDNRKITIFYHQLVLMWDKNVRGGNGALYRR